MVCRSSHTGCKLAIEPPRLQQGYGYIEDTDAATLTLKEWKQGGEHLGELSAIALQSPSQLSAQTPGPAEGVDLSAPGLEN